MRSLASLSLFRKRVTGRTAQMLATDDNQTKNWTSIIDSSAELDRVLVTPVILMYYPVSEPSMRT